MADIIIHKSDLISEYEALKHALEVVRLGRISGENTCYSYITKFSDGFIVFANKKKADIFTVSKLGREKNENYTTI